MSKTQQTKERMWTQEGARASSLPSPPRCWFFIFARAVWLASAYTIRMHGLRLAPPPLSLREETSLFTVDNWGVMKNNCSESEGALCTTSGEGEERGEPQGDASCSISTGLFSVRAVLHSPSSSPPSLAFNSQIKNAGGAREPQRSN